MQNAINTDKDNKQGADTACNDKGSSGSDPGNMESIFQNDPAKIHTDNHNKYIEKSSQKIISGIFQETVEYVWFFYKKSGEQGCGKKNISSHKQYAESQCLKKMVTGTHPGDHPPDDVCIDQNVKRSK